MSTKATNKMTLSIAAEYGNVDVRNGSPKGYCHVPGQRLQSLCRKLGIKFAPALVDIEREGHYGRPKFDGVVVSARSAPALEAKIAARAKRTAMSPAATRKAKALQEWEESFRPQSAQMDRCKRLGIWWGSDTARKLLNGDIDDDFAELIGFKTRYRHTFSDYDRRFRQFYDPTHAGNMERIDYEADGRERRRIAREQMVEDEIPPSWPEYCRNTDSSRPRRGSLL